MKAKTFFYFLALAAFLFAGGFFYAEAQEELPDLALGDGTPPAREEDAPAEGGETWVAERSGVTNDLNNISCPATSTCYIVGGAPIIGGNGVILKTTDGGETWRTQTIPVTNPLRGISCVNTTHCFVAGDGGALLKTVNGGTTWTRLAVGTSASTHYYWDIWALDANTAVAVGNAGKIFRTSNGGTTWTEISSGVVHNLHGVYFANAAIGWIMGGGGTLLKTINSGTTWLPLNTPTGSNILWDAYSADGSKLWVTKDLGMLKSTNGGVTLISQNIEPTVTYRGAHFITHTNGWIVGGGGIIQHSTDGGTEWQEEESGTGVILRDIECWDGVCHAVGDDGVILRRGAPVSEEEARGGPQQTREAFNENLSTDQKIRAEAFSKRHKATKRIRGVSLNPNIVRNDRINFNLFPDVTLVGEVTRRDEKPDGTTLWKGRIQGKPKSTVSLVKKGNIVVGNIRTTEGVYQISPTGKGAYTVHFIDPNLLPEDLHLEEGEAPRPLRAVVPPQEPLEAVATIDVLVAYTIDALTDYGGEHDVMEAFINLMIDESNEVYENSGIGLRLRLAGTHYFPFNDYGDALEERNYMTFSTDEEAVELRQERARVDADIVTLLVKDGGEYCGFSRTMTAALVDEFAPLAFNAVDVDCAISNWTFVHELGHHMGAGHNPEDQTAVTPLYSYSYGYRNENAGFRTMMAYACPDGACPKIPFFSTPNIRRDGNRIGIAEEADNVRTLNNSRFIVSAFSENLDTSGSAAEDPSAEAAADLAEAIGIKEKPSILPGSLGYFLKSVGRGMKAALTFNPKKKAELRLRYASEKVLEARALAERGQENQAVKHLKKFQKDIGTVQNLTDGIGKKNVADAEEVTAKLLEYQLKYQALIGTLQRHASGQKKEEVRVVRTEERERIAKTLELIGDAKKIKEVVEKTLEVKNDRKDTRYSIDVLRRLKTQVPEKAKAVIEEVVIKKEAEIQKGSSPSLPSPSGKLEVCPKIVSPVCGTNGKTYDTSCEAKQAGVKIAYKGICTEENMTKKKEEEAAPTESIPVVQKCPAAQEFVCGKNGITYLNSCFAHDANVDVIYKGVCVDPAAPSETKAPVTPTTPILDIVCTQQYDPVCGEDGKTYGNACTAKQSGVDVAYGGACKDVTTPSQTPTISLCPSTKEPVCGTDNKTYTNSCYAKQSAVGVQYNGECKIAVPPPPPTAVYQCSDGIDNDKDGYGDLKDPGCNDRQDNDETDVVTQPSSPPTTPPQCNDGVDNDKDGFSDLKDPGCTDVQDNDETNVISEPPPTTIIYQCSDGIDNDKDGYVDLKDPDCTDTKDNDETHTVAPPLLPPTAKLTTTGSAISITIAVGSSATLSWTTTDATSVTLNPGIGTVAVSGTFTVKPTKTTTYVLTASNSASTTTVSLTVTVK